LKSVKLTVYIYFSSAFSSLSVRPGRIRAGLEEKFRARAEPGPEKIDRAGFFFGENPGPARPVNITDIFVLQMQGGSMKTGHF